MSTHFSFSCNPDSLGPSAKRRLMTADAEGFFHCDECDYKARHKDSIGRHGRMFHRGNVRNACVGCGKKFYYKQDHNKHVITCASIQGDSLYSKPPAEDQTHEQRRQVLQQPESTSTTPAGSSDHPVGKKIKLEKEAAVQDVQRASVAVDLSEFVDSKLKQPIAITANCKVEPTTTAAESHSKETPLIRDQIDQTSSGKDKAIPWALPEQLSGLLQSFPSVSAAQSTAGLFQILKDVTMKQFKNVAGEGKAIEIIAHKNGFACRKCGYASNQKSNTLRHIKSIHKVAAVCRCGSRKCSTCSSRSASGKSTEHPKPVDSTSHRGATTDGDQKTVLDSNPAEKLAGSDGGNEAPADSVEISFSNAEFHCGVSLCSFWHKKRCEVVNHIRKRHGLKVRTFECKVCKKESLIRASHERHEEDCFKMKDYLQMEGDIFCCKLCPLKTKGRADFIRHVERHLKKKSSTIKSQVRCPSCQEQFSKEEFWLEHRNKFTDMSGAMTCSQVIESSIPISLEAQASSKTFQCELCPVKMKLKCSLIRHHRTVHLNMKKYSCSNCHRKYRDWRDLQVHSTNHSTESGMLTCKPLLEGDVDHPKPQALLKLEEGLPLIDKGRTDFIGHVDTHMKKQTAINESQIKCPSCQEQFLSEELWLEHRNNFTELTGAMTCSQVIEFSIPTEARAGTEMFQCGQCPVQMPSKYRLLRHHSTIHLKMKKFSCSNCNQKFRDRRDLQRHTTTHSTESGMLTCKSPLEGKADQHKPVAALHLEEELLPRTPESILSQQMTSSLQPVALGEFVSNPNEWDLFKNRGKPSHKDADSHQAAKLVTDEIKYARYTPRCIICTKRFGSPQYLNYHQAILGGQLCSKFSLKLEQPGLSNPDLGELKCSSCEDFKCNDMTTFNNHLELCYRASNYPAGLTCKVCGYSSSRNNFLRHAREVHENKRRHLCLTCKAGFSEKRDIENHLMKSVVTSEGEVRCLVDLKFVCKGCNVELPSIEASLNHLKSCSHQQDSILDSGFLYGAEAVLVSADQELTCCMCNFQADHKASFTEHVRQRHIEAKNLSCSECQKPFSSQGKLARHLFSQHRR